MSRLLLPFSVFAPGVLGLGRIGARLRTNHYLALLWVLFCPATLCDAADVTVAYSRHSVAPNGRLVFFWTKGTTNQMCGIQTIPVPAERPAMLCLQDQRELFAPDLMVNWSPNSKKLVCVVKDPKGAPPVKSMPFLGGAFPSTSLRVLELGTSTNEAIISSEVTTSSSNVDQERIAAYSSPFWLSDNELLFERTELHKGKWFLRLMVLDMRTLSQRPVFPEYPSSPLEQAFLPPYAVDRSRGLVIAAGASVKALRGGVVYEVDVRNGTRRELVSRNELYSGRHVPDVNMRRVSGPTVHCGWKGVERVVMKTRDCKTRSIADAVAGTSPMVRTWIWNENEGQACCLGVFFFDVTFSDGMQYAVESRPHNRTNRHIYLSRVEEKGATPVQLTSGNVRDDTPTWCGKNRVVYRRDGVQIRCLEFNDGGDRTADITLVHAGAVRATGGGSGVKP